MTQWITIRCILLVPLFAVFVLKPSCGQTIGGTGDLRIATPTAHTRIERGTRYTITWANASYTAKNILHVKIELYKEGERIHTFAENVFNTGEYTALFLSTLSQGMVKVKITSIDGTAFTFSDEFEIIPTIPIKILQPAANDVWHYNAKKSIQWQDQSLHSQVYINLFRVGEDEQLVSVERIADGIKNDGQYAYTVPTTLAEGVYVIGIRMPPIAEMKYSKPFTITGAE